MANRELGVLRPMAKFFSFLAAGVSAVIALQCVDCPSASALELDWSGQFASEATFVLNYSMDGSDRGAAVDATRAGKGGYYIPGGGSKDANFESLFLRLRPKLVVNDNIYIKSEWWVGDPIYGLFGSSLPYQIDQRQFYSFNSRGSAISAQRVWAELVTDLGTVQVGRMPLNWGLGLVWSSGDDLWSRYMSTGDGIRWVAKFGAFSFIPSVLVNTSGNTIGGSCTVTGGICVPGIGSGGVTDYSLIVKYENTEDELEAGVNLIKRLGGSAQDPASGVLTPYGNPQTAGSMNFNTFDFFAKKKFRTLSLGVEVPIVTGNMAGSTYQTFGVATEANWKINETWEPMLKVGYAPGQSGLGTSKIDTFRAFYFNPNYHVGMIMFNYQLANFAGPQTRNNSNLNESSLASPYDNPIVNAAYASLGANIKPWEKWTFKPSFLYAVAPNAAGGSPFHYNYWNRQVHATTPGTAQGAILGAEIDLGISFQWDEYFQFSLDNGVFFPGSFYAFSNTPTQNTTSPVFATAVRVGITF